MTFLTALFYSLAAWFVLCAICAVWLEWNARRLAKS